MKAVDVLMHEHRVIEKVLGALETYVADVEKGRDVPLKDLAEFVTFIREFADRCHHGKEEDILFAAMVEHGFSKEMGPVAVMLHEHAEGRRLVRALVEAAKQPGWTADLRRGVVENARAYADLLEAHIKKEDSILYPMAEQRLPHDRMEAMAEEFEAFEANIMGKGVHEQYHALADKLIARYAGNAPHTPACHHGHTHNHAST